MKQRPHMLQRLISGILVLAFAFTISAPGCRGLIAYAEEAGTQTAQNQQAQPATEDAESAEPAQEATLAQKIAKWKPVLIGAAVVGGAVVVLALLGSASTGGSKSETAAYSGSYIGNKNSKVVHLSSCTNLPDTKNRVFFASYSAAIAEGYTPCGICLK